jgi:amidase
VIPESEHQDTVGTFGRTVRDAVYALDAIYGIDERDNYTLAQEGHTPAGGYAQFVTDRHALQNASFGIPWGSFWGNIKTEELAVLTAVIEALKEAGATIVNNTELKNYGTVVPKSWNWSVSLLCSKHFFFRFSKT